MRDISSRCCVIVYCVFIGWVYEGCNLLLAPLVHSAMGLWPCSCVTHRRDYQDWSHPVVQAEGTSPLRSGLLFHRWNSSWTFPSSDIPRIHLGPGMAPLLNIQVLIPAQQYCSLQGYFVLGNLSVTSYQCGQKSSVLCWSGTASHEAMAGFAPLCLRNGSLWVIDTGFEWHRMDWTLAGLGD